MSDDQIRFFPLGEAALTVEFGRTISESLNKKVIAVARRIDETAFSGFIESVPAYSSVSVFYDVVTVKKNFPDFPTGYDAVCSIVKSAIATAVTESVEDKIAIEIPVDFSKAAGLDLEIVAEHNSLSVENLISIFTASTYRVYMLGFLPGFAYMGEVAASIAMPRKQSPRQSVPRGSIGIAGRQTGIYSLASPGGWQIIGRTDIEMFTPKAENPCFLKPGDCVRFVSKNVQ